MKNYGTVRSTVRPNDLVVDEFSAWENTNITKVSENVGLMNEFVGYSYKCVQYEKDEYIGKLSNEKKELTLVTDDLIKKLAARGLI